MQDVAGMLSSSQTAPSTLPTGKLIASPQYREAYERKWKTIYLVGGDGHAKRLVTALKSLPEYNRRYL